MPFESKSKEINGRRYTVPTMPSLEALDVFESLSKVVGPGIAALQSSGLKGDLQPAAHAVFSTLGGGQLRQLAAALLKGATVELTARDGNVVNAPLLEIANAHFAGRVFELFKVMAFSVEVNFGDFSDGLRTLIADVRKPAPVPGSDSPIA